VPSGCLRTVTVVSPPDRITQGGERLAALRHRARQARVHLARLARLAFHLVAEDVRVQPAARAGRGGRFQRLLRRRDQCTCWPWNTRSPASASPARPAPAGS
jgi:hypothetical protein